jgi:Spy/CpxP family protein refolding chaperone
MEGMTMVRYCFAVVAAATLALAAGQGWLGAEEPKTEVGKGHHWERLATKLGLSDKQKEEIHKIHADFDEKADPVEHQLWSLHHQEREAMRQVLTDEQRAKLPAVFKELRDQELQKIADKLNLTEEQRQKIGKVREEFETKFRELAAQKEKGDNVHRQFRELRHQFIAAVRPELTEEQRAKLPVILREEHRHWRNPEARRETFKAVGEKLGVSAEQKEQLKKIRDEYSPKAEALAAKLKEMHQDEHAAIEKVLTEDQRTKWQELRKSRGLGEEK